MKQLALRLSRVLLIAIVLAILILPVQTIYAGTDHYWVGGIGTISNGIGTITASPTILTVSTNTINVTGLGTLLINIPGGLTGTATSGALAIIVGSPVTLTPASQNTITVGGAIGTITITLTQTTVSNWSSIYSWATSSGGVSGAVVPTSADNVFFDANSFSAASQTVNVDAAANCLDMDWTGATNTPTLAINNVLHFSGNTTFIASIIVNGTTYLASSGTTTHLLTTNGLTLNNAGISADGGSTNIISLQDNLTTKDISNYYGTLLTNNYTVNIVTFNTLRLPGFLTLGSSVVNVSSSWSGVDITLTANTSTVNISGIGAFIGGGITTYNIVNLIGSAHTISGSNTFAQLNGLSSATQTLTFTDGTTQTVGTSNLSGSVGHVHTLQGSGAGSWNIVKTGGGYLSEDYLSISRSIATPTPNIWYAGTHSTNGGNNSGWFFIAPDVPTVSTQAATLIHAEDATGNGNITNLGAGNINVTSRGFDWGTAPATYTGSATDIGSYPAGAFTKLISSLPTNTTIYYRSKAQNSIGWGYGNELSFLTSVIFPPTNLTISSNGIITWTTGLYAIGTTIIRGTGAYPTSLTDGTNIYSGIGTTVTDVNPNPDTTTYYYSAWGYSGITYSSTYTTQTSGGAGMVLLAFIVLLGILLIVNILSRNSFIPIKLMAAFAWTIPLVWVISYPPSIITTGSNIQTILILIIIGMLLICGFNAFRQPLQMGRTRIGKNGETENTSEDSGSWHMPNFVKNSYRNVTGYQATGKERTNRMYTSYNEYRKQVHASLFPRENNRRRR